MIDKLSHTNSILINFLPLGTDTVTLNAVVGVDTAHAHSLADTARHTEGPAHSIHNPVVGDAASTVVGWVPEG